MNVDEALRQLGAAGGLPREALLWSLDHWDEASPRLIARLRAVANHPDPQNRGDEDLAAVFMIVHLCAERRDGRAYAPLCRLIESDAEFAAWFDGGIRDTLPGVLINLFDGDVEPLRDAIESAQGDAEARADALIALAYLARERGALSDDEMRDYLMALRKRLPAQKNSPFWTEWAVAVGCLGYDSLRAEVGRLFSAGAIDRELYALESFHAALALSRQDADGLAAFRDIGVGPFGGVMEAFAREGSEENGDADDELGFESEAGDIERPFVNPLRDIGRNDPCPCGSGKKYKKCCLAA